LQAKLGGWGFVSNKKVKVSNIVGEAIERKGGGRRGEEGKGDFDL
jgi:hypothetical protein